MFLKIVLLYADQSNSASLEQGRLSRVGYALQIYRSRGGQVNGNSRSVNAKRMFQKDK